MASISSSWDQRSTQNSQRERGVSEKKRPTNTHTSHTTPPHPTPEFHNNHMRRAELQYIEAPKEAGTPRAPLRREHAQRSKAPAQNGPPTCSVKTSPSCPTLESRTHPATPPALSAGRMHTRCTGFNCACTATPCAKCETQKRVLRTR
jgi:hypothetical protein